MYMTLFDMFLTRFGRFVFSHPFLYTFIRSNSPMRFE